MSYYGRTTIRAFRPSCFVGRQEFEEDMRQERMANLAIYVKRAREGLPLFDGAAVKNQRNNRKI